MINKNLIFEIDKRKQNNFLRTLTGREIIL